MRTRKGRGAGTGGGAVQTSRSRRDAQPLDHLALEEVVVDDFVHVVATGRPVPDALGIDHHQRPQIAKAEARTLSNADAIFPQHIGLDPARQGFQQRLTSAVGSARAAWMARRANGGADEDVILGRHGYPLGNSEARLINQTPTLRYSDQERPTVLSSRENNSWQRASGLPDM